MTLYRSIALITALAASFSTAVAEPANEARELLKQGRADAAYDLLAPLIDTNADPEVDYLIGIAALDSGRPGIALFAFQRVLAANPDHLYARAELGRALFRMGELDEALEEFSRARALDPPAEVAQRLAGYEEAAAAATGPRYRLSGYVAAFGGFDTNYASATSDRQVGIPAFGNILFTLDDLFVEDESPFVGGRVGGALTAAINPATTFVLDTHVGGAEYTDSNSDFYSVTVRGSTGVFHRYGPQDLVGVRFHGYSTWARTLNYVKVFGVTATWDHTLSNSGQINSFIRVARLYHDEVIDYRDAKQYLAGTGYTHLFQRARVGLHVVGGTEQEVEDAREDIGRELFGIRLDGTYLVTRNINVRGAVMGQFSWYGADDPLFLRTRQDDQWRINAALDYRFGTNWMLTPEVGYIENSSNLPTNDFDRFVATVSLQCNFN